MLRLGSKYNIEHIRSEAIRRLKRCFPDSLKNFRTRYTDSSISFLPEEDFQKSARFPGSTTSLQRRDAVAVVNLARAHNLHFLLPAAFYVCSAIPFRDIMSGYRDNWGEFWKLSDDDIVRYVDGQGKLRKADAQNFAWALLSELSNKCKDKDGCANTLRNLRKSLWKRIPLGQQALSDSGRIPHILNGTLCAPCLSEAKRRYDIEREATWEALGEYFDLLPPLENADANS